jgi:hypothetical protein
MSKEALKLALEAGNGDEEWLIIAKQLFKHFPEETQRFAELVAQHEREACAKVADYYSMHDQDTPSDIAEAIRARGEA